MKLSFRIALGLREFEIMVRLWIESEAWDEVLDKIMKQNLFNQNSQASTLRIYSEIRERIQCLTPESLSDFLEWDQEDRRAIAFVAACKCYPFIFDFVQTVLKDKLQVFDEVLIDEDFNNYWNTKAVDIPELDEVAQ